MALRRIRITLFALAAAAGAALADDSALGRGPGWTGLTEPEELIEARQALMVSIERLMKPIDSYTIGEPANPDDLRSAATSVSQLLLALPHLFPPTTNLFDPRDAEPKTLALPAIWENFDVFRRLADAASESGDRMSKTEGDEALRQAALALRASCDACHQPFLRPYHGPEATEQDRDFDFESVLPK